MESRISNYELELTKLKETHVKTNEEKSNFKEEKLKTLEEIKTLNEKLFNVSMSLDTKTKMITLNNQLIDDLYSKIADLSQYI